MRYYYRGPWQWLPVNGRQLWAVPWAKACLDLRSIPEQSQIGGTPGLGIFVTDQPVSDSNYDLLCAGSWYNAKPVQKVKDAIPKRRGYSPKGEDFVGVLWDILTDGADPAGQEFAKPLMPTVDGRFELILEQRHVERAARGKLSSNVRDVYRAEFADLFQQAQDGKLKDAEHHLRVLDAWCEKHGIDDWKEFVPPGLQKDVPGRKKHETLLEESFNKADSDTLGPDQTWNEISGDFDIVSNACQLQGFGGVLYNARAEADLSSADHYCTATVSALGSGFDAVEAGPVCRFSSSASTGYVATLFQGDNKIYLYKLVAGANTVLASTLITPTIPGDFKCECNGSTVKGYQDGVERVSVTDTAISGNLRCGIAAFRSEVTTPKPSIDSWRASDIGAGGVNYTQLERSTRGILRGVYTRF